MRTFVQQGKPVAVICHGPWMLVEADVVRDRDVTSWPSLETDIRNAGGKWRDDEVVVDKGLGTSRRPDDLKAFCAKLVEDFREGRHAVASGAGCDRELMLAVAKERPASAGLLRSVASSVRSSSRPRPQEEWPLGTATQDEAGRIGYPRSPGNRSSSRPPFRYLPFDPQLARERLRSWPCGSGADRQVALGSTDVQDAQRGDRSRPWGAGTRERRARKALEGDSGGRHDRSDRQDSTAHARRYRGGRAPRFSWRSSHAVRGDARVARRPGTARGRTWAFPSAWRQPRRTPNKAGAAPTRRTAPRTSVTRPSESLLRSADA